MTDLNEIVPVATTWLTDNALLVSLVAVGVLAVSTGYLLWLNHRKNEIIVSLMEDRE